MVKLLVREVVLVLLSGVAGMYFIPYLFGQKPVAPLFVVGFLMGLTFAPMYAIAMLGGNKMPARVRNWLGPVAWLAAFGVELTRFVQLQGTSASVSGVAVYTYIAPPLFGLLLPGVAALRAKAGERGGVALKTLYAYSFSMAEVRWLLVPMIGINAVGVMIAMQAGALYLTARVLLGIFYPSRVEGNMTDPPLLHKPVPDAIAGLVERTSRRRARPYATQAGGGLNQNAISILCAPEDVAGVTSRLNEALAGQPYVAAGGETVEEGKVEVVIRLRDEA